MTWPNPAPPQWQPNYAPVVQVPQSRFGIASFVIGLIVGVVMFVLIVIAGVMETQTPGGIDEESPQAIVLGLGLIGGMAVAVLGVVFGIVGVASPNVRKIFAILGIVFNALILLGVVGLMILGSLA